MNFSTKFLLAVMCAFLLVLAQPTASTAMLFVCCYVAVVQFVGWLNN